MKLSKTLLSTLLAGISLYTLESCKKDVLTPDSKKQKQEQEAKKQPEAPQYPANCPACGMG
jgi:hypothetical protein